MRAFLTRVDSWWWDVCMYEVKKLNTSKAMLTVRERESQQGQITVPFQGRIFCASCPEWLRVGCLEPTFSWRESSQRGVRVDVSHRVLMRSHPVWICCSGTQQQAGYLQLNENIPCATRESFSVNCYFFLQVILLLILFWLKFCLCGTMDILLPVLGAKRLHSP